MGHRRIVGLKWARPLRGVPPFGPAKPRGAKRQGLLYERALASALPTAKHGQWFEFEDANGLGLAQPDFILPVGGALVVLEAKYSWVPEAQTQIERLYRPILEIQTAKPILGIVVVKRLVAGIEAPICGSLREAIILAKPGVPSVLHWMDPRLAPQFEELGNGPISAGLSPPVA